MEIQTNISLKDFTTMKLGGNARFMTEVRSADEAATAYRNAERQALPIFVLGGGSNVIARDDGFNGIVIRIRISGFEVVADDVSSTTIRIGAGEDWDLVVKRTVDMNLSGIEAMSAIPGTAGAGPVQNTGAYGQEINDTLQSLEAYDSQTDSFVTLRNTDCGFSYRDSVFKGHDKGRYIITYVILKLSKDPPKPPFYDSLQSYLDKHNITVFTAKVIRSAVIELRKNKLPDPRLLANSGSFFKNTVIEAWQVNDLRAIDPNIPVYNMGNNNYKVPTGWLIEHSGLKGQLIHGMRIYDKNALVLINESAVSYQDLADARDEIAGKVRDMFNIQIQQEPLEI
jgi:UDP-N-acetylmuramate dehydrogenase